MIRDYACACAYTCGALVSSPLIYSALLRVRVRPCECVYVRGWGICVHKCEMLQLLSSTFSTGAGDELGQWSGLEGGSVTTGVAAMALPSSQWDIVRAREQLQNDVDMFNACFPVQGKPVREHESRILFRVHGTCVWEQASLYAHYEAVKLYQNCTLPERSAWAAVRV